MANAESVKNKLQGLIQKSNQTTGKNDTDMTAAIGSLIAGFGQGGGGDGLAYDMGEFDLLYPARTGDSEIPHKLGDTPDFVCVWSDHWAGLTSDNPVTEDDKTSTSVGFIWMKEISGMLFRASSTAVGTPLTMSLHINNNDYRLNVNLPNSAAYGMQNGWVDAKKFRTPTFGNNGPWYRAGVTYKYFVCKAWWNVGGVASAE